MKTKIKIQNKTCKHAASMVTKGSTPFLKPTSTKETKRGIQKETIDFWCFFIVWFFYLFFNCFILFFYCFFNWRNHGGSDLVQLRRQHRKQTHPPWNTQKTTGLLKAGLLRNHVEIIWDDTTQNYFDVKRFFDVNHSFGNQNIFDVKKVFDVNKIFNVKTILT